ncbi:hypothetical protein Aperf_G00000097038 [Anoplocephala perfoliata]
MSFQVALFDVFRLSPWLSFIFYVQDVFAFGELRDIDSIKALAPNSQLNNLLNLFCYGVYGDHKKASIPALSDLQLRKLRLLTILSACEYHHCIFYDDLLKSLELTSLRELEDLIIELIYADAIVGKLDQQHRILVVESASGRDFKQEDLPKLKSDLDSWCDRVNDSMKKLAENFTTATTLKSEFLATKAPESASINHTSQVVDCKMEVGVFDESNGSPPIGEATSSNGGCEKDRKGSLR